MSIASHLTSHGRVNCRAGAAQGTGGRDSFQPNQRRSRQRHARHGPARRRRLAAPAAPVLVRRLHVPPGSSPLPRRRHARRTSGRGQQSVTHVGGVRTRKSSACAASHSAAVSMRNWLASMSWDEWGGGCTAASGHMQACELEGRSACGAGRPALFSSVGWGGGRRQQLLSLGVASREPAAAAHTYLDPDERLGRTQSCALPPLACVNSDRKLSSWSSKSSADSAAGNRGAGGGMHTCGDAAGATGDRLQSTSAQPAARQQRGWIAGRQH